MQYSVVGESFANPDGTERQSIIDKLHEGNVVHLRREPENRYDSNAIAVMSQFGVIGMIGRNDAAFLAPKMDAGQSYDAEICFISETDDEHPLKGVCIEVHSAGVAPRARHRAVAASPAPIRKEAAQLEPIHWAAIILGLAVALVAAWAFHDNLTAPSESLPPVSTALPVVPDGFYDGTTTNNPVVPKPRPSFPERKHTKHRHPHNSIAQKPVN